MHNFNEDRVVTKNRPSRNRHVAPVIYFGAPIKNKKAVPPDIRSLNINLLPMAPNQVNIDVLFRPLDRVVRFTRAPFPSYTSKVPSKSSPKVLHKYLMKCYSTRYPYSMKSVVRTLRFETSGGWSAGLMRLNDESKHFHLFTISSGIVASTSTDPTSSRRSNPSPRGRTITIGSEVRNNVMHACDEAYGR
jgi:hypothetical protein